jgi:hypothetical protein
MLRRETVQQENLGLKERIVMASKKAQIDNLMLIDYYRLVAIYRNVVI